MAGLRGTQCKFSVPTPCIKEAYSRLLPSTQASTLLPVNIVKIMVTLMLTVSNIDHSLKKYKT